MNDYGQKLPFTGMGVLTVLGVHFNMWADMGVAVGLILAGVLCVRIGFRKGKKVTQR